MFYQLSKIKLGLSMVQAIQFHQLSKIKLGLSVAQAIQ
jgi:hypothetical protein